MIAITGANGKLGKETLQKLLEKVVPTTIVAIVRNPKTIQEFQKRGFHIRQADYNDFNTLKQAFKGISTLLQISTTSTGDSGKQQEKNVVLAAKEQGVDHIVYTSSPTPKPDAKFLGTQQAHATEQEILKSGMPYTFFRNSIYMEAIPELIGSALQTGSIHYPSGNGKVSFVSRTDIAEAIAKALAEESHKNKTYEITGNKAWTFQELAQLIGNRKNIALNHTNILEKAFKSNLLEQHLPVSLTELLVSMASGIKAGEFSHVEKTLEELLNRPVLSLNEYIKGL